MTKIKINDNVWQIFVSSLKFYFSNFTTFIKYMAFPVLGQFIGIVLTFVLSLIYASKIPLLVEKFQAFNDVTVILGVMLLVALPGLIIFMKAFWEYLVAYGSVNSMVDNALQSGRIYDISAHTELVTRRSVGYIGLWFLFSIFLLIGLNPLLWVIAWILFIYFILIFQVFTYNDDLSPVDCFKKSFEMIKNNFWRTFGLLVLIGSFTYIIIPELIKFVLNLLNIIAFFGIYLEPWAAQLHLSEIPYINITPLFLANFIISSCIAGVSIAFTLPLRSICWALWYKALEK